jgi:hypothetical protein
MTSSTLTDEDFDKQRSRQPYSLPDNLLTRVVVTLAWFGAAVVCFYLPPNIAKPFQNPTNPIMDLLALVVPLAGLVFYIAIPVCLGMGVQHLFRKHEHVL